MARSLSWFIGLRYVRSKQEEGFFSLISIFSFAAMCLGVAALIIVLSVMNGFDREIKERILDVVPHVTVIPEGPGAVSLDSRRLASLPGVQTVSPYVDGQGMLSAGGYLEGVSVQGIDPEGKSAFSPLAEKMIAGNLERLRPGDYGVVLGSLLARSLGVMTGDQVLLTLPQLTITPVGAFPRVKHLRVVGIFQVGAQVDSGIALVHVDDAARLYRTGGHEGIRLTVANPFDLSGIIGATRGEAGEEVRVATWQEEMSALFAAIRMEKTVVGLLLAVIIAVAGFNIVASLVLMVAAKRRDIAVLKAMGAESGTVTGIFRVQGGAAGFSGVALGTAAGCLIAWQLGDIVAALESLFGVSVFDPQVYFISRLPTDIRLTDVLVVAGLGLAVSLVATLYPAYRAGQISPAEILRYEH